MGRLIEEKELERLTQGCMEDWISVLTEAVKAEHDRFGVDCPDKVEVLATWPDRVLVVTEEALFEANTCSGKDAFGIMEIKEVGTVTEAESYLAQGRRLLEASEQELLQVLVEMMRAQKSFDLVNFKAASDWTKLFEAKQSTWRAMAKGADVTLPAPPGPLGKESLYIEAIRAKAAGVAKRLEAWAGILEGVILGRGGLAREVEDLGEAAVRYMREMAKRLEETHQLGEAIRLYEMTLARWDELIVTAKAVTRRNDGSV